ncbi:MAG TPA: RluA family pseudouridine synthase [Candidatus Saccharimonadales bacterium]|nr:RluA family pseudouridine synthase [Candidatus Saccharimonadales bacterium]
MLNFDVTDIYQNERLDKFLTEKVPDLSRSFITKLIADKKIYINEKAPKPSGKLKTGDKISVNYNLNLLKKSPKIKLPIIYEDNDCIVINKPAGVLSHSKGLFNPEATVASFIKDKIADMSDNRAGIVHRLDRGTSGVMICAKNKKSQAWLQKQFSARNVKKSYIALINGNLEPKAAVIDMPIERNPRKPQTFRTGPNGKPAVTQYKTINQNDAYSLIELRPETGRTHQLRVHLKQLNHPIVGDDLYDGSEAGRLYLHALSLELTLPNRKREKFTAKLPLEFSKMVK